MAFGAAEFAFLLSHQKSLIKLLKPPKRNSWRRNPGLRLAGSTNVHDSINAFQSSLRNAFEGCFRDMSATQDFDTLKAQLEERIANRAKEKESVQKEVEMLGQKVALKELERQAKALEGELGGLKGRKSALEQRLAGYATPTAQNPAPQQKPMVRTVAQ